MPNASVHGFGMGHDRTEHGHVPRSGTRSAAAHAPSSDRMPPQGGTHLSGPYQSPGDLRSLALTLRQRGRTGALAPSDVARYCDRILENAAEWERQQRAAACLPLLDRLGLTIVRPANEGPKR